VVSFFIGPGIIRPTLFPCIQRDIPWGGRRNFKDIDSSNIFKEVHGKRECNLQAEINVSLEALDTDKINSSALRADFVQPSIFNEIDVSGCGLVEGKVKVITTNSQSASLSWCQGPI
jgi:hypothetical protein